MTSPPTPLHQRWRGEKTPKPECYFLFIRRKGVSKDSFFITPPSPLGEGAQRADEAED